MSILAIFIQCPADAKLGQDISEFIKKHKEQYKLRATTTQDDSSHYNLSLIVEDSERQAAPGFGAGCTVTARNGKIVGESMAICLGKDKFLGGQLASAYGLKFACEAIGRTIPGDKTAQERELEVFNKTTIEALSGVPKEIRYPGFESKIILSRGGDGILLIAVVRPVQPAAVPTSTKAPSKAVTITIPGDSGLVPPAKARTSTPTVSKPIVSPLVPPTYVKTVSKNSLSPAAVKAPATIAKPSFSALVPPPVVKPKESKNGSVKQPSSISAIKNAIKQSTKE